MKSMEKFMKALHEDFCERCIIEPNYRVKLIGREIIGRSDWAWVVVDIYKPRKKRPCQTRKLAFNFVKGLLDYEKSTVCDYEICGY